MTHFLYYIYIYIYIGIACHDDCQTCVGSPSNFCVTCPGDTFMCPANPTAIYGSCVSDCGTSCIINGNWSFQLNATFCQSIKKNNFMSK